MQFSNKIILSSPLPALPIHHLISRISFLNGSAFKNGLGVPPVFCLVFYILFFVLISPVFSADYSYISINDPFIRKIPVAVPEFKSLTGNEKEALLEQEARKILGDGLDFTGYLKIMDPLAFLEKPSEKGVAKKDINFKNWTGIGAELLVTGEIIQQGSSVRLKLRLFDTFKESLLVGKIYTGHQEDIRRMVHRFCGEIVHYLTGKWGIYSSSIAFVSTVNGNKEIFACEFDGHNPRQLTNLKTITLSPSWSSDGEWLAYTSYAAGKPDLYIRNIKENHGSVVNLEGLNITPDWFPGAFSLAATLSFSGDQEIYLLTGKGDIQKKLTDNWGIDVSPSFSPDGKKMAFVSKRSGTPQIYVKDLESGTVVRLTFQGRYNTSPAWSPEGDKLAYVGIVKNSINIYVIGVYGGEPVQLTRDSGDNEDPSWSPDGNLIAFSSTREGVSRIYVMTSAGGEQRPLLKLEGAQTDPDWSQGHDG